MTTNTTQIRSAGPADSASAVVEPKAATIKALAMIRQTNGHISQDLMASEAARLGVHPDYLSRLVRRYTTSGRLPTVRDVSSQKILLGDEHRAKVAYFLFKGDAVGAFEFLTDNGTLAKPMSLRTFQRRVAEWDPAIRACAKHGYAAMVQHQFFNTEHIPYRGYAFGTDHTKLPIMVLPDRGSTEPVWPWLTTVVDLCTRVVLSYRLTVLTPTAVDSLDTLVEAVHGFYTADDVFVGGKPEFLRSDRGGDYISAALTSGLMSMDIGRQFTLPYSSWQNGVVERINGTIDAKFAPTIPGYHKGGEDQYTRRVLKNPINVTSLVSVSALDRRLSEFFGDYNNRPHSSLNGQTPLEAWAADPEPVATADPEVIVNAMSPRTTRRLHKYGVEVRGAIYSHPALAALRRINVRDVEIRYHDHDFDHIEVFVNGIRECTATKTSVQSDEQKAGVVSIRGKQRRDATRLMFEADRERVLLERERQREEGIDETEWPEMPPMPVELTHPYGTSEDTDEEASPTSFDDTTANAIFGQLNNLLANDPDHGMDAAS